MTTVASNEPKYAIHIIYKNYVPRGSSTNVIGSISPGSLDGGSGSGIGFGGGKG
jgi:hypothetical protein